MNKFWEYTLTGVVAGLVMGWLLSLVSGNYYVILMVGGLGTIIGIVLGIIHRKNTNSKWF